MRHCGDVDTLVIQHQLVDLLGLVRGRFCLFMFAFLSTRLKLLTYELLDMSTVIRGVTVGAVILARGTHTHVDAGVG